MNLSPETCWADFKRLINEKVVASCWLFTSSFPIQLDTFHNFPYANETSAVGLNYEA